MNRALYLLAYTIPVAVWVSMKLEGSYSYFALFYAFGFLPLLELFLPAPSSNLNDLEVMNRDRDRSFDFLLYSMVPIQWGLVYRFCEVFPSAGLSNRIGLASALGVACGVIGINVAHELGHRRGRIERILARLLRAIRDSFINAWNLDRKEMLFGLSFELALVSSIGIFFGSACLIGFVCAALFGILLLQSVNYIEHYGLCRARKAPGAFESVKPHHSWNANQSLSRAILFELSRHSDHHAFASRKYQTLRHFEEAPQMPTGYPGMILLALVPPLWFRVMNPRIPALSGNS